MTYKKIMGKTPAGGDYSEIYYYDSDGSPIDEEKASKCIIRECKADGTLLNEIFGACNKEPLTT